MASCHVRMMKQTVSQDKIEEVLDLDLIEQQIEAETLQFEQYAGYILGGYSCTGVCIVV